MALWSDSVEFDVHSADAVEPTVEQVPVAAEPVTGGRRFRLLVTGGGIVVVLGASLAVRAPLTQESAGLPSDTPAAQVVPERAEGEPVLPRPERRREEKEVSGRGARPQPSPSQAAQPAATRRPEPAPAPASPPASAPAVAPDGPGEFF